jgi:hypothetical protein
LKRKRKIQHGAQTFFVVGWRNELSTLSPECKFYLLKKVGKWSTEEEERFGVGRKELGNDCYLIVLAFVKTRDKLCSSWEY